MRRDVGRAQLECFERHARHDAGALDAAAGRHGVIAIERAQQRRFARAVGAVHHPAVAGGDFEIHAAQDVHVVDVHVGAPQRDQHAPALGRRERAHGAAGARKAGASCRSSSRAAVGAHRAAAPDAPAVELEQMGH